MAWNNMASSRDISRGVSGSAYDMTVERRLDDSTLTKMQKQYWEAKQIFLRNIKKKEDDCIVASDADLDAKLELFRSIEDTCSHLLWTLERYQDRLWVMAHEESSFGRFLRDSGKLDKTRAGLMLTSTGKTLSYTAQQRIMMRDPLVRLYKDIETFQYRAVTDTYETIDRMESARTAYRAALLWMKDVSQKLDPDTYKQLEKFRKVQTHVKLCKQKFERMKLDTHQKVDMLAASRVNMFSHSLAFYQKAWLNFFEHTSATMSAVSQAFTGFQYYDFNILKELKDPSKKQAEQVTRKEMEEKLSKIFGHEPDQASFFSRDYEDEDEDERENHREEKRRRRHQRRKTSSPNNHSKLPDSSSSPAPDLLDLQSNGEGKKKADSTDITDLLSACSADEKELLADIFSTTKPLESATQVASTQPSTSSLLDSPPSSSSLLPSQLLTSEFGGLSPTSHQRVPEVPTLPLSSSSTSQPQKKTASRKDESLDKWLNLFSELDPLANPDAIGSKDAHQEDRNC